ncbi:MAG: GspE/PulE family protein [Verrucomicrobiota bacterium]|nr:GspE/PulE family protein [Verrucomicrobiota bacterium]
MELTPSYIRNVNSFDNIDIAILVNNIILDAVGQQASDIHIEPWENTIVIRLRISGILQELTHLPLELLDRITGRIKVMADLVTYESDLPQEGRAPASSEFGNVELRVSVFPTVRGEKIVIRLFDPRNRSFDLETLGLEPNTLIKFKKLIQRPSGLILLNGPTGSGKTTVIYSALCHIVNTLGPAISISTVEDPVEFNLPMISQSQISNTRGFTYPKALRSLMRQDPEAIMIGEIRDPETASIAVQAGLTGHMVISTIHSDNTAGVYARLINMDIEPFLLASSITGILGLRLLRKICPNCKIETKPNNEQAALLSEDYLNSTTFYTGVGCKECADTGYNGRSVVTELLISDELIRDGVIQKTRTRKLRDIATEQGMTTLWQNALAKVKNGNTSMSEVIRTIAVDQM